MSSTDYFVIATAANNRQVNAIIDRVEENLRRDMGVKPFHREGIERTARGRHSTTAASSCVFQPRPRDYLRLEAWN